MTKRGQRVPGKFSENSHSVYSFKGYNEVSVRFFSPGHKVSEINRATSTALKEKKKLRTKNSIPREAIICCKGTRKIFSDIQGHKN